MIPDETWTAAQFLALDVNIVPVGTRVTLSPVETVRVEEMSFVVTESDELFLTETTHDALLEQAARDKGLH